MAAKRYWRLVGISTQAGGDLELSELRLYEGGVVADTGATLTVTATPSSGSLGVLTDGLTNVFATWTRADYGASGFAFMWDFGIAGGVTTPLVVLGSGNSAGTFVRDLIAQSSLDGVVWETYKGTASAKYPGALGLSDTALLSDPLSDNVKLLLTDSFVDRASPPKTMTVTGDVTISSAQLLGGKPTLYFDGLGDYISTPSNVSDFNVGTGDFTVELFIWQLSRSPGEYDTLFQFDTTSGVGKSLYLMVSAAFLGFLASNGSGGWGVLKSIDLSLLPSLNAWHHIALTRSGSTWTMWVDGVSIGSATYAGAVVTPSTQFQIGWSGTSDSYFHGYIGGFRFTKGVARYTTTFTPPTQFGEDSFIDETINPTALVRPTNTPVLLYTPSVPPPTSAAVGHMREHTFFDAYNGGVGNVVGTVKEKNTPANTPLHRRVLLVDEASRITIRETWSDPITGAFEFRGVKQGVKYSTISYDHLHNYRAVIADNQDTA